jgi:negative regulator of flagellin synthesis FlgM
MNTTISNNGLPKFPQASNGPGNGSATTAAASPGTTAAAPKSDDQLKLTDSALALQLADGSYKVDAGNIADRMLAFERQLGGAAKA